MQFSGRYDTNFDDEFLVESYLYFNKSDEDELTSSEFKQLIKNKKLKKKNIVRTIFMYNPFYFPLGYDEKKSLTSQGFEFNSDFHSLKIEKEIALFRAKIKQYDGQIIEIRTLFNLNIKKIDHLEILMKFNEDTELLNTNQLTHFDKSMNYVDVHNLNINGKFVFFAWGNKINKKEFLYIHDYAYNIYDKCVQMQKKISFLYRQSTQSKYATEHLHFLHPSDTSKFAYRMPDSLEKVFETHPPQIAPFNDINSNRI
jgi:hypothetical protein